MVKEKKTMSVKGWISDLSFFGSKTTTNLQRPISMTINWQRVGIIATKWLENTATSSFETSSLFLFSLDQTQHYSQSWIQDKPRTIHYQLIDHRRRNLFFALYTDTLSPFTILNFSFSKLRGYTRKALKKINRKDKD